MPKQQINLGRQKRAALSRKQERFIAEYDRTNGNGTLAAKRAGYSASSDNVLAQQARQNLRLPHVKAELARLEAKDGLNITPIRVQRRLDEISHASQGAGQFGPAVRAEELLGKSIGMWVDQTIQLSGVLNDAHVTALIELAKRRQQKPIDLVDDQASHNSSHTEDDEG